MKRKFWQVGILWTIAFYWVCLSHRSIAINILPPPSIGATSYRNLASNIQSDNYQSNGEWIGRLILPTQAQISRSNLTDWVWVEIKHAPDAHRALIGKTVPLTWQPKSTIEADVRQVTTDIQFTPETIASQKQGNIHPYRLNHRARVGALQSLAGARTLDDVLVGLTGVKIATESDRSIVTIDREPIQITGSLIGLVKILGTDTPRDTCMARDICPNEYFRVQHYQLNSRGFDGQIETIRIPQATATSSGLLPSQIRDLALSPGGADGWYIYGDRDSVRLFTVAAIQPRSLLTLKPSHDIIELDSKLEYLDRQHWDNTPQQKGKLSQVTFDRHQEKLGDRALAIHLFGGIGGKNGDAPGVWQTVTGHFAYGMARVTRSTFTQELEWHLDYNQVYAHNPDGIIAGKQDWATYMGHLQRGWLATRPVSDLLISYPPVTVDYDFGGIQLSPLTELERQLHIFGARYRTGDGTGSASVTPATSCVQDANQALYLTIRQLNRQVQSQPQIQAWIDAHPQHPQTLRFRELQSLGSDLETTLAPLGIVRQDWQQNAAKLAGIQVAKSFTSSSNPIAGLISWRTMLPRGAQDGIAKIFSQHGATIWFLNTYQVGGTNLDIIPIAPTVLFGQFPLLSTVVIRLWAGISTLPNLAGWLLVVALLIGYAVVALALGLRTRFLTLNVPAKINSEGMWKNIRSILHLFFLPALIEELGFRLLLIPHPIETATSGVTSLYSIGSLILFIIYHPLNALTFFKLGNPTFMDWRFLTLAGLLGIACTIAYLSTGSIWTAVLIHWLVVVVWLKLLGGEQRLALSQC
jgi:predicted Abi (CAAX) family protease